MEDTLIQIPQRTRVALAILQDYEVIVDKEVTKDGDFVHFPLLADGEPINDKEVKIIMIHQ